MTAGDDGDVYGSISRGRGGGGMSKAAKQVTALAELVSDVEPNETIPMNWPVTRAPPLQPSYEMPYPSVKDVPPAWTAQSMAPAAVTCITNASANPRFVSDVVSNKAAPVK